jgi:3-methyladenine DNA glycosylase Mpg
MSLCALAAFEPADVPARGPSAWFDAIAAAAIRRTALVVAPPGAAPTRGHAQRFGILEVEFYYDAASHRDPFAHRSAAQLGAPGHWYFHRERAAKLGFTLKGLDLTLGPPGAAGGMLIRAVVCADGAVVEGPSRVVDLVLRAAGVTSVLELKALEGYYDDAFVRVGVLRLEPRGQLPSPGEVRVGPRVGLSVRRPEDAPLAAAAYRYRARAALTQRDRRGLLAGRLLPERLLPERPPPAAPAAPALTDAELDAVLGWAS